MVTRKITIINLVDQCSTNVESSYDKFASDGDPSRPSTSPKSSNENFKNSNWPTPKTDDVDTFASLSSDFEMIDEGTCAYSYSSNLPTEGACAENKASPGLSGSRCDDAVTQMLIQMKIFDVTNRVGIASQMNLPINDPSKACNLSDIEKDYHSKPPPDLTKVVDKDDEKQLSEIEKQLMNYETPPSGINNKMFGCSSKENDSSTVHSLNESDKLAANVDSQNGPSTANKLSFDSPPDGAASEVSHLFHHL